LTEDDLIYIEAITSDPCAYCGAPMEHVDHIDPVALDGASDWSNFTPSCGACNRSKSDKPLLLFLVGDR
jgi:5-methylcytosine-specific restriction endonuclease McrA